MHMQHALRPTAFMQIIDILGNEQQVSRKFRFQPGQRFMRGIGLHSRQSFAAHIVEAEHERGIASKAFGCGNILDPVLFP